MGKCIDKRVWGVIGMAFFKKSKIGVALIWICFLVGNGAVVARHYELP
jgi:hypothetical protein